jgi:DNA mismatch repair protein MSH5
VDIDESKILLRPAVKPNIDPELDGLKRNYDGLESFLIEAAKFIRTKIPISHQDLALALEIQYFPGIGHVVEVPQSVAPELLGFFEAAGTPWSHRFTAQLVIKLA